MADRHRARLRRPQRADLTECRFHLVDHNLTRCHTASDGDTKALNYPTDSPKTLTYRATS
jgi:hypothetical protein